MMFYSDAVRQAQQVAMIADVGAAPVLRVYSGSVPADEAASLGAAVLIAQGTLPNPAMSSTNGVITKVGTWTLTGQAGAGAGVAGTFWRMFKNNGTDVCLQGTFGVGQEMVPDVNSIANGQTVTVTAFTVTRGN
jgi:hypothetical protein